MTTMRKPRNPPVCGGGGSNRLSRVCNLVALAAVLGLVLSACPGTGNSKPGTPDTTVPAEVTGLSANAGNENVTLSWTDPADTDLARIEITFTPPVTSLEQPITVAKGTGTSEIRGLTNETPYTFTLKTVDTGGNKSEGETVTATPTGGPYTVSFDLNGGDGTAPADQTIPYGGKVTRPADPNRTNYEFDDWYLPGATDPWNFNTDTVTGNITLKAEWQINTYTVTFDLNGGDGTAPADQAIPYGGTVTRPADPNRTGYTFIGWYVTDETVLWDFTATAVTGNITLKAEWRDTLSTIAGITAYLTSESGGSTAADPILLPLSLELSTANWTALLTAINTANKFVALDLSACTASTATSGSGLYTSGANKVFDPDYTITTGPDKIVSLTLPDAATVIPDTVNWGYNTTFKNFSALKTVSGAGIITVGSYAFYGCTSLTTVNLPAATTISGNAFMGCTSLATLSLPSATYINGYAFQSCTSLTSVSLPVVTYIGTFVFAGCTSLTTFIVAEANTRYRSSADGKLLSKDGTTLIAYPSAAGAVTLPGITTVSDGAFMSCTGLTSVSLPAATSIGGQAFPYCTGLTNLSLPATPPTMNSFAFYPLGSSTNYQTIEIKIPAAAGANKAAYTAAGWIEGKTATNNPGQLFLGYVTLTITEE